MIEILLIAVVSMMLFRLGLGPLLFLVPLQVLLVRRGRRAFAVATILALGLIVLTGVLLTRRWTTDGPTSVASAFVFMDRIQMAMAVVLAGGLILIQAPERFRELALPRMRRATRLLIATGFAALMSVPLILYLQSSEIFAVSMQRFVGDLLGNTTLALQQAPAQTGEAGSPEVAALLGFLRVGLLRSYLFYYYIILTVGWWLGTIIGSRSLGLQPSLTRVADFKLPDTYVWPLIGSLALVILTFLLPLEPLAAAAWNTLLILLFLYGVAGLGIIRHLIRQGKIHPRTLLIAAAAIVVLSMIPRIGIAVLSLIPILIPGLGVSEVWLKYRKEERSNV